MFVDASALVAILTLEEGHHALADGLRRAKVRMTSGIAVYEAALAIARLMAMPAIEAHTIVIDFLARTRIGMVPIATNEAEAAVAACARFGKGQGHPAQLNLGDCFAYACAQTNDLPLLFVGNDFSRTDIVPALN